ncbi:HAMP domain-containing protein [Desulfospira joergensenii]|uniref:HAMP domain-containing protein n=1 Tax=Desulfospira joergensenii TaxID=53329 RepID=UPI0003B5914B|nr:HAMP domain-containing protein [Desulfospira joergensenii]
MIVQCKECQKMLEVDETQLTKDLMRGACPNCKAIIEVAKPGIEADERETGQGETSTRTKEPAGNIPNSDPMENREEPASSVGREKENPPATRNQRSGTLTIGKKLLFLFLAFILITGGGLSFLYMTYVPSMMQDQISLRTYSIAQSFSGAILQPLLTKNYLLVNQTAVNNAKLPHVAYVSVLNSRGIVIAGILGNKTLFDSDFRANIENSGFPKQISSRNRIPTGSEKSVLNFIVGGQKIHDVAVAIGETGGEVHVGVFTADVEKAVQKSLMPLLALLAAIVLGGSLCFYLVARSISLPIRKLTQAAEKISIGEMDHPIEIKGGGEIQDLADSLERMRFSINTAMDRLMQQ